MLHPEIRLTRYDFRGSKVVGMVQSACQAESDMKNSKFINNNNGTNSTETTYREIVSH